MMLFWEPLRINKYLNDLITERINNSISSAFILLGEDESGKNMIIDNLKLSLKENKLVKFIFDCDLDHYVILERFEKDFINSLKLQFEDFLYMNSLDKSSFQNLFTIMKSENLSIDIIIKILNSLISSILNKQEKVIETEYKSQIILILRNFAIVRGDKKTERILKDFFINLAFSIIDEVKDLTLILESNETNWINEIVKFGNGGKLDSRLFASKISFNAEINTRNLNELLEEISEKKRFNIAEIYKELSETKDLSYEKVITYLIQKGIL